MYMSNMRVHNTHNQREERITLPVHTDAHSMDARISIHVCMYQPTLMFMQLEHYIHTHVHTSGNFT